MPVRVRSSEGLGVSCSARKDMSAIAPLRDRLIVDVHVGLRKKRNEAFLDAELRGGRLSVLGST